MAIDVRILDGVDYSSIWRIKKKNRVVEDLEVKILGHIRSIADLFHCFIHQRRGK